MENKDYKKLYEETLLENEKLKNDMVNMSRNMIEVMSAMNNQREEYDKMKVEYEALKRENQDLITIAENTEEIVKAVVSFTSSIGEIINK